MTRQRKGFTLVELLVVIGIIALLISILMPSLARARQSANLVACQSNFKQVYTALSFYANENKGLLPWASVMKPDGTDANVGDSGTCDQTWRVLSELLGSKVDNVWTDKLSPVFTCTEAEFNMTNVWAPNMIRTILFHPRAMPGYDQQKADFANKATMPPQYPQRKLASIRNSAEKIAFWEGAQLPAWNATSEPEMQGLDNWRSGYGHMYREEIPASESGNYWDNNRRQDPVIMGAGNRDDNWFVTFMRFRHNKNSTGPIAFWDGHVETRSAKPDATGTWIPDVKVEEIRIAN
jgi:prepilin-type N-terminal cleavage/methylation domain-containing protein/prepilin-type processing-associated H-X9-DG protein